LIIEPRRRKKKTKTTIAFEVQSNKETDSFIGMCAVKRERERECEKDDRRKEAIIFGGNKKMCEKSLADQISMEPLKKLSALASQSDQ
jgi:hypothetical protein